MLPIEIWGEVFSHLPPQALGRCSQVCQSWHKQNLVTLCYEKQRLHSNDQIMKSIEEFINRVSLGKNGRFRCILSTGKNYQSIEIIIKGSPTPFEAEPNAGVPNRMLNEICWDFKEDFITTHDVGDGDVSVSYAETLHILSGGLTYHSTKTHSYVQRHHFLILAVFPDLKNGNMKLQAHRLLERKVDILAEQYFDRKATFFVTSIGFILSSVFYLGGLYTTAVITAALALIIIFRANYIKKTRFS